MLDYLKREGVRYREDSSNATSLYRRNRIRRELLPVMEQIAPAIVRRLERQSHVLRADDEYLEEIVDHVYRSTVIVEPSGNQRFERQMFARLPAALQRRLVRRSSSRGRSRGAGAESAYSRKTCVGWWPASPRVCFRSEGLT